AVYRGNAQWSIWRRRRPTYCALAVGEVHEEEDGTRIVHDRERFSHELTLVFANGKTQILTHEKQEAE
ncbi:MAG TPA: hypothetical protein VN948_16650, partial [Terriglobales bacterium]|nr:hypothetical protein [Terriglobales bacterium]